MFIPSNTLFFCLIFLIKVLSAESISSINFYTHTYPGYHHQVKIQDISRKFQGSLGPPPNQYTVDKLIQYSFILKIYLCSVLGNSQQLSLHLLLLRYSPHFFLRQILQLQFMSLNCSFCFLFVGSY